jgi:ankyrin repeat protein
MQFVGVVQVDVADCDADTALHAATSALHLQVVTRLTEVLEDEELAKLLARPNVRGNTPLHCTFDKLLEGEMGISRNVTEIVQHFVALHKKLGVSLDVQDTDRATPLCLAAKYNVPDAVKILIEAGADTNIATSWGETPLTAAAAAPSVQIMLDLLKAGAAPQATLERSKETAMHIVIHTGLTEDECVRVCERLIDCGGDVDALDIDEKSPIVRAAEHHRQKLVGLPRQLTSMNLESPACETLSAA